MDREILEKYMKAGRIAGEVREAGKEIAKPGVLLLDVAEKLEKMILDKGGEIAFPVNISVNDIAAHYTPYMNDETKIQKDDIVKIDIGVHVDGYIGDTACTVAWNEKHNKLMEASQKALEAAIPMCMPGTKTDIISERIQETIEGLGFKPISNLSGHGLEKNNLHAEPQILNIKSNTNIVLEEDQVIAIEPFATDGDGRVKDSDQTLIYMLLQPAAVRSDNAREIMAYGSTRNRLPFAERWIPIDSRIKIKLAIRELLMRNAVYGYPVLKESGNGLISQAEHTVIVRETPIVTTKI